MRRSRKPKGMPDTLRRDLESYRLQAAQVEIARHRLVALDLLAFTAACSRADQTRFDRSGRAIPGAASHPGRPEGARPPPATP